MKCSFCKGEVRKIRGELPFNSPTLGEVQVPDIEYTQCLECKEILLTPKESEKISSFIKIKEQEAIAKLPIEEFITISQALEILGITKQAFSKNPKIKRGFIFSVNIDGRKLYNRESVELFKETNGNGKYIISKNSLEKKIEDLESLFISKLSFVESKLEQIGAELRFNSYYMKASIEISEEDFHVSRNLLGAAQTLSGKIAKVYEFQPKAKHFVGGG